MVTEGKVHCQWQNGALLLRRRMYQKVTIVGNGILNQHGLRRILAPMEETRNRLCEIF